MLFSCMITKTPTEHMYTLSSYNNYYIHVYISNLLAICTQACLNLCVTEPVIKLT